MNLLPNWILWCCNMSNSIVGLTCIAYPESMKPEWPSILDALKVGYCYALHDKDVKISEDTGEAIPKKAHYHFYFLGKLSKKEISIIYDAFNISYSQPVRNASAMYDYMTHDHDANKYHYDKSIIKYSDKWNQEAFDLNYSPAVDYFGAIKHYIDEYELLEYDELLDCLYENGRMDLIEYAGKYFIIQYMKCKTFKAKNK